MTTTLPAPVTRPRFGGILGAEWTKIKSVRSTYWTILVAVLGSIGLTVLFTLAIVAAWEDMPGTQRVMFEPVSFSMAWISVAQTAIVVFGALVITSEFGTGQIRSSLSAVPNRPLLLSAKAIDVALVGLVVGVVATFPSFFAGQAIFATIEIDVGLGEPGVLAVLARGALTVALMGLLGLGFGALLRNTAGAITLPLALLWLPAIFGGLLPEWVQENIMAFTPAFAINAMLQLSSEVTGPWQFTPTGGTVIIIAWVAIVLVAAAFVINRRDA